MDWLHEIAIREVVSFIGAVIGLIWGYMLGVSVERRRWWANLHPVLEVLRANVERTEAIIHTRAGPT